MFKCSQAVFHPALELDTKSGQRLRAGRKAALGSRLAGSAAIFRRCHHLHKVSLNHNVAL